MSMQYPRSHEATVHGEQFAGDNVTVAFTLAHTPIRGATAFVSGVRVDVTVLAAVVTFAVAPPNLVPIRIDYEWQP